MNKYLEVISKMMDDSFMFTLLTMIVFVFLLAAFLLSIIATYGLTLLAALLWWCYIIYKEANK